MPNPTYAKVQEGAALAKEKNVDFILAVGGGSVIDCCKIISAQAKTDKDIWEMEFTDHVFRQNRSDGRCCDGDRNRCGDE